ncbi:MAG: hypothetical protein J3K34DRAFT_379780 [Monoraphidium minutum]|nr:MAG: hypothetical protein J3K34DRAFT_379780 [Monoraphidium minutum]
MEGRRGRLVLAGALVAVLLVGSAAAEEPPGKDAVGFGELKEDWRGEVVHLSWRPRAFHYKRFLSDEECDHLIAIAKPRLERADVVNDETGELEPSDTRTSTGTFLDEAQDEVVAAVEKRVATVTMTPLANQECIQVLRYANGQKYEAHTDYFHDALNAAPEVGGQRLVTVLMYLSTPEEGGETVFPDSGTQTPREGLSGCVKGGLAHRPMKGDMLLFYSLHPDGSPDPTSMHESCPTLKGEKWSATIWVHTGTYHDRDDEGHPIPRTGEGEDEQPACRDSNEMCAEWAFFGECAKNPGYMLDGCKQACGICQPAGGDAPPEAKPPPPLEVLRAARARGGSEDAAGGGAEGKQ